MRINELIPWIYIVIILTLPIIDLKYIDFMFDSRIKKKVSSRFKKKVVF